MRTIDIRLYQPRRFWQKPMYQLITPLTVRGFTIPAGFKSDGASVPRIFWPVFPPVGKWFAPAVLHDFLLGQHDRSEADAEFYWALREEKVNWFPALLMWAGVRIFGIVKQSLTK